MVNKTEEKVEDGVKATEAVKPKQPKVVLSPDHFASRQQAHDMKVAKFLSKALFLLEIS